MPVLARWAAVVYFGVLAVVSVLIVLEQLDSVLPADVAAHVSRNNEGIVALLLLSLWIVVLRRWPDVSWGVAFAAAGGLGLAAVLVLVLDTKSTVRTLNETLFAVAVLVLYCRLPRPLPAWGWALPAASLIAIVTTSHTDWGVDLAETYFFVLLVPIALDWADRSILEPAQPQRLDRLVAWTVFIVAAPAAFAALRPDQPYENLLEEVLRYLSRPTEAFVAVLMLHLFFSYGPRIWGSAESRRAPVGSTV